MPRGLVGAMVVAFMGEGQIGSGKEHTRGADSRDHARAAREQATKPARHGGSTVAAIARDASPTGSLRRERQIWEDGRAIPSTGEG